MAALLTRDEEHSEHLLRNGGTLELNLIRNTDKLTIRRHRHRFVESIGKIPILAVPDIRFIDRTETTVGLSEDLYGDLREYGAYHFLHQTSYASTIQKLLAEICLDYWEHRRTFNLPVFNFIRRVFTLITDEQFEFHSIERVGRTSFKIEVLTEGSENPIPIQFASQGTLAVLSIFGLIRSFLKSLRPKIDEERLHEESAIVIIDEIDAHLHPVWQQRMTGALRQVFPRIQFIVSAHSPLIVAGSLEREVAILRKRTDGFGIEQEDVAFVGASARKLYEEVFDIKEIDDSLRLHPTWQPIDQQDLRQIRQLDDSQEHRELTADESLKLASLKREARIRRLAEAALIDHKDEDMVVLKLEAEIERLKEQIRHLGGNISEADG